MGANTMAMKMPHAVMFASTSSGRETIEQMLSILRQIKSSGLNDEWLQHIKNTYITRSYINDQSASAITDNLGSAEILGNWQYADDLPQLVRMVTVEQVNSALNFYIGGLQWAFLGNAEAVEGFKVPPY
ncbi:MAG: hypothetical protein NVSMB24_17270 [Mucilaginibacter sp.]